MGSHIHSLEHLQAIKSYSLHRASRTYQATPQSNTMHFLKLIALTGFFASAAYAVPTDPVKPSKPGKPAPPPPPPTQQNACGNGAAPFCCNTDSKGGYTSCYAFEFSSQCSQTAVCCNAQNSIQICLGNAEITGKPF